MPIEWNAGLLIPILRKGDSTVCENYRAIVLLNTAYKILTSLIRRRLERHTQSKIGDYQQRFRKGRSTVDAIHTITQTVENFSEHNI